VYPLVAASGSTLNDYDPALRGRSVQSWNISLQRALTRNTVLDTRYVGNRSLHLWSTINLNETNIFENGFLDDFKIAQRNLAIAQAANPASTNYGNQGLPGQRDISMIRIALGNTTDSTTATRLVRGQAGNLANTIATTASQMARLTAAGYPVNMFMVNPATGGSAANLTTNLGATGYNSLQVELRRRMSAGVLLQGSYVWSHSLSRQNTSTLRDLGTDGFNAPSAFDLRHAFKLNGIWELPFGQGRRYFGQLQNPVARRAVEGWSLAAVARVQSGASMNLTSGRGTYNNSDSGVVLYNITTAQLQDMIQIRKTTDVKGNGLIYWLPQSIVDNSNAAFEVNGKTLKDLDPNQPYVISGVSLRAVVQQVRHQPGETHAHL
jgi:hypothetical protein